jgi:polyvinyl alcohol dehydrogenase (cytochrome)
MRFRLVRSTIVGLLVGTRAFAQAPASATPARTPDGSAVFAQACASCHLQPAPDSRAPAREVLGQLAPETILTALTTGNMFRQGSALSDAERRAVAGFLAGRAVGTAAAFPAEGRCTAAPRALQARDVENGWNGWGVNAANARALTLAQGGLSAPMVPRLRLKWAFGFAGVSSARSQPAVMGGRVFVGSESGDLFSLDAKTGCTQWTFHAQAGIRTAPSVGPYRAGGRSGMAVYIADGGATAYAVDAQTGALIWARKVDDHPYAKSTGSLTVHGGRVYVPVAGVGEEGQGGTARYRCCTFRGSVSSLDANTGAVVWKAWTIDEPKPRGTNKDGVALFGPAGGGVWSAPTVDAKRRLVYVATGNGYAEPAQPTTDAVLAFDMATGALRWSAQPTPAEVWTGGCRAQNPDNPNCPATLGPDFDFSASPMLVTRADKRELLVIQQKSGMVYAFDPDKRGEKVWEYRASNGAAMGGQWGGASDGRYAYFGVNGNGQGQPPGGVRAVRLDTGQELWSKPPNDRLCGTERGCSAAQGAAATAIPGIVFVGSMDGGLRAYASDDGAMVWQFDTNKEFQTVNGVKAKGGAMDGPGAAVGGGMLFINSGYVSLIGRPGNVLLAFGVD